MTREPTKPPAGLVKPPPPPPPPKESRGKFERRVIELEKRVQDLAGDLREVADQLEDLAGEVSPSGPIAIGLACDGWRDGR